MRGLFTRRMSPLAAAALMLASIVAPGRASAAGDPVTLDVQVHLVDAERRPIAQRPLRLSVGADAMQHQRNALALVTDHGGVARTSLRQVLVRRLKKMPTNFTSSLFSLPQNAVHVPLGLELQAFGQPWWWTLEIDRFVDATVARPAEFTAWPADAAGRHAAPLRWQGPADGALLPDGRRITVLPWRPVDVQLMPADGDATRWTLSLTVMQATAARVP